MEIKETASATSSTITVARVNETKLMVSRIGVGENHVSNNVGVSSAPILELLTKLPRSLQPGIAPWRLVPPNARAMRSVLRLNMLQKEIGSRYSGRFLIGKDLDVV